MDIFIFPKRNERIIIYKTMKRQAFKMYLKEGKKAEYRKRHDEIWPELEHLLREAGIREYSIFLDEETNTLFAFQQLEGDSGSQDLGKSPVVQRWWDFMADIMEVNPDNSPVIVSLEEVFYMP